MFLSHLVDGHIKKVSFCEPCFFLHGGPDITSAKFSALFDSGSDQAHEGGQEFMKHGSTTSRHPVDKGEQFSAELKRILANSAFDFLVSDKRHMLTTSESGNAIGMTAGFVRNLIETGALEAFADSAMGKRPSYRVIRRSVLLYLAENAQFEPADFHRRVNALFAFLTREQLALTSIWVANLIQKL